MDPASNPVSSATPGGGTTTVRRASSGNLLVKLDHALRHDPAFQVMTVEGTHWIDPFTGTRIHAPARAWLIAQQPWTKARLKKVADLQIFRWRLYLHQHIEQDARLRQFAQDGRWLNPYSGQWVNLGGHHGALTAQALRGMATHLSQCAQAQSGRMLPQRYLDELVLAMRPAGTKATTRISGWRAAHQERLPFPTPRVDDPELAEARSTIEGLISPLPSIEGFGFAVHYEPYVGAGGDFYECLRLNDGRVLIIMGDVTGHGLQGAKTAMVALQTLHLILREERHLMPIIAALNDALRGQLPKGQFVTVFAGILDVATQRLSCLCAGHHPALLLSMERGTVVSRVGGRAPALGLVTSDALRLSLAPQEVQLQRGDVLFLYTDGLSEARDGLQEEYGEERVMGSVLAHLRQPYDRLVANVVADVRRFAEGVLDDDLTVLAIAVHTGNVSQA
jgi:Stage II sporulation protein E (SpoIIE)